MSGPLPFLGPAWLDRRRDLLAPLDVRGVPDGLRVARTVAKAPGGDVTWVDRYEGGHLVASEVGAGDADITLTTPYADAVRILAGELGENSAYMQGLTKTAGVTGPLLSLLAHSQTDGHQAARAELLAATAFED